MDDLQQDVLHPPLTTEAFFALVETTAHLVAASEKYWSAQGLNGARIRVLVEIAKAGGTIVPSSLANMVGVTKANISLIVVPLESEGFIERAEHPEDGRKTMISLTAKGYELLKKHLPNNRQVVAEKMGGLTNSELHQLLALLSKLRK